jgi:hypothetical protein
VCRERKVRGGSCGWCGVMFLEKMKEEEKEILE